MKFIVTEKAQRPANMNGRCFYCKQSIGEPHKSDCVLIKRKVKVLLEVKYEISVPAFWSKEYIEFYRNDGSWCGDNLIEELQMLSRNSGCLCPFVHYEYIEDTSEAMLCEGRIYRRCVRLL